MKSNIILSAFLATILSANEYSGNYRFTYENIDITPKESMGLVGVGVDFDFSKYIYGGVGLYGSVKGKRGGFFTVGFDGGLKYNIAKNIRFKGGLFVGAGGGGAAPQGGGLMLRPYSQIDITMQNFNVGLGVSHIDFPNGKIKSTQGYISFELPTSGKFLKGHSFDSVRLNGLKDINHNLNFSILAEHYKPKSSKNLDGTAMKPFSLMGIKVSKFYNKNLYSTFQAAGAGGGENAGYMEVFGGLGYKWNIDNLPIYLTVQTLLGAGGGGRVNSGGGLLYSVDTAIGANVTNNINISASIGRIGAFNKKFKATKYSLMLGYKTDIVDDSISKSLNTLPLSFRVLNKSYLNGKKLFKSNKGVKRVDLLGFAIDYYLNKNIYLTGQTFWAYKGKAGGYAEGIFGLGYKTNKWRNLSLYTEALIGVGGGGGVKIDGGLFGVIGGGVNYEISKDLSLIAGISYARNRSKHFSTKVVNLGLKYKFSLLSK